MGNIICRRVALASGTSGCHCGALRCRLHCGTLLAPTDPAMLLATYHPVQPSISVDGVGTRIVILELTVVPGTPMYMVPQC